MSIATYEKKRNFNDTSEPRQSNAKSKKGLRFVVQRHHASHLHYDFRLEMDGVLKSWAIPKGPSLNPKDKRLAMMVEDHPYDYRTFEGEIPKGNYGAGTVYLFDEGTYQSLNKSRKEDEKELLKQLKAGSLKFKLNGKILKGEFALVKIKNSEQNAWLLIKHNDDGATDKKFDIEKLIPKEIIKEGKDFKKKETPVKEKAVAQPKAREENSYSPMLAKLANTVFDDPDWIYERKIDGYRIIAHLNKEPRLVSRNNIDYTENFATISKALKSIKKQAVLDGEVVAENEKGEQKFQLLQNYENGDKAVSLKYHVFDLLSLDGNDVTELPLLQRKKLLEQLLNKYPSETIVFNDHVLGEGQKLFKKAEKEGWEGIIGKRASDEYFTGKRSDSWLKFKLVNSQEAIICGYTKPAGSRNYFGALVLGMHTQQNKIKYIGNCGTGFNDDSLKELYEKLSSMILVKKPLVGKVNQEKNVTWVRPELICEVNFTEWTGDEHLRHPVYKGLREDKNQDEIIKETAENEVTKEEKVNEKELTINKKKVKLTNLNKLYWDKEGYTKGDLIHYYDRMSSYILPYLKDKPLSLNRHPNGAYKAGFYQKDVEVSQLPSWAKTTQIHSESNNKEIDYLVCNDKASLLFMANLGCIEINPWLSTYKNPEHPEFMVIDLDPDGNSFKEVINVALKVKEVLDGMKIPSFIKTSGSTGMHIFIYIAGKYDYDFVKDFAAFIANKAHELMPEITSIERSPSKRKGLIYIDFLQNRRGQTIAAPYAARPKPGATVSMPLNWDEVNEDLDMKDYDIFSVPEMIQKRKDPWKDLNKVKVDIKKALKQLG